MAQHYFTSTRARRRLTIAGATALIAHLCLFGMGWKILQTLSTPSNENRALVLTIEPSNEDGVTPNEANSEDTINDAKLGAASGMQATQAPSTLSQQTSVAFPKPTFEIEPELKLEPDSEEEFAGLETAAEPQEKSVTQELLPSVTSQELSSAEIEATTAPLETDLLTANEGAIAIVDTLKKIDELAPETVQVPQEQNRMVQETVQKWIQNLDDIDQVDDTFSWQHKGQTFVAKFSHRPASTNMDHDEIVVEVRTEQNGQALLTELSLKKLAFSNFAQFIHRWDPNVKMHKDEMDGRFHSNSQILVDFDRKTRPIFHGKVTTASYRVNYEQFARRNTRMDIFRGGLETGVKKIHMPRPQMDFVGEFDEEGSESLIFTEDTRIYFHETGALSWIAINPKPEAGKPTYGFVEWSDAPMYLLAEKGATLFVSGTVKGKVMVYSPTRIVIEDDLVVNSLADNDMLGLVSGKDVVIARQEFTGLGDLHINASIYARRRFVVRDFSKPFSGTLKILGSVSAGSVSATQPRYATKISFDKRFEHIRPPGFPTTDRYEIASADLDWSVTDDDIDAEASGGATALPN